MLNKSWNGECGWIRLVQDREKCWAVVHTAMNHPVPYFPTDCGVVDFSRSTVLHGVCLFAVCFSETHDV